MSILSVDTRYPIPGWTSDEELDFLRDEAVASVSHALGDVLEVGCWLGRSTLQLARHAHVDVVDTFAGSSAPGLILPEGSSHLEQFERNMIEHGVVKNIHAYLGTSYYWLQRLPGPYRLIFIDGCHDFEVALHDIVMGKYLLSPGGTLVVDDVCVEFSGVQRAVKIALNNDVDGVGKMGVWRKPRDARAVQE